MTNQKIREEPTHVRLMMTALETDIARSGAGVMVNLTARKTKKKRRKTMKQTLTLSLTTSAISTRTTTIWDQACASTILIAKVKEFAVISSIVSDTRDAKMTNRMIKILSAWSMSLSTLKVLVNATTQCTAKATDIAVNSAFVSESRTARMTKWRLSRSVRSTSSRTCLDPINVLVIMNAVVKEHVAQMASAMAIAVASELLHFSSYCRLSNYICFLYGWKMAFNN